MRITIRSMTSFQNEGRERSAARVVLTGGPGAGKTAVLEVLRRTARPDVRVLPEAAGIVFAGGFPRRPSHAARACAQRAIQHVQVELETLALADDATLVLCDRGVIDGVAYWPGDEDSFFAGAHMPRQAALARYDLVVHLLVPGDDAGYDRLGNPMRIETAAEARAIDARITHAWRGHPRIVTIADTPDFATKLERAVSAVTAAYPARFIGWGAGGV